MIVKHSRGQYPIQFRSFELPQGDIVILTDENLAREYPHLATKNCIVVEAGESSKLVETYIWVCEQMVLYRASRKTKLVALGGGVIGDLGGFVAATYMRGIPFIQVPTTLLAQVDSSVGGKVGLDLAAGKNLIGAFNPPSEVIIDTEFLKTLPERERQCGLAEVLKYGFILDPTILKDVHVVPIETIVRRCIELKKQVVEADEFETLGIRASLNFGHTVGHAIEQFTGYKKYTHGEAISVGMAVEAKIAAQMGLSQPEVTDTVISNLEEHGLPIHAPELEKVEELIELMKRDKKAENGKIAMSLVCSFGDCRLVTDVPTEVIRRALVSG
jgi:3-dehydroquinate synthase